jgi:PAS domain S-box-containing protein
VTPVRRGLAASTGMAADQVATLRLDDDGGASAREARRFVTDTLAAWGDAERFDDATLVASELVTNALLHAPGTPPVLILRRRPGALRIEVLDGSAAVPIARPPVAGAGAAAGMTGRGLHLVEQLSAAWGTTVLDVGKVTWAEFGDEANRRGWAGAPSASASASASQRAHESAEAHAALAATPPEGWRAVTLEQLPVRLVQASERQLDDLVRELQLLAIDPAAPLPSHYRAAADELLARYGANREAGRVEARAAAEAGVARIDLTLTVPEEAGLELIHLTELLDQLAELCRRGTLLAPAPSPEVSAYRHWCANEVGRQLAGRPPTACPFEVDDPVSDDATTIEELRFREARYRSLIEAGELDVWRATADGRLITDMPKWRVHTGQSDAAVLGDGWLQAVHPDHRERVWATWQRAVDGELAVYQCEYPIVGAAGSLRHVVARAAPVRERGRIREWVGTTVDVTEQRRAEEELAEQAGIVETLHEIGMALATTVDIDELVARFVETTTRLAGADVGAFLFDRVDERGVGHRSVTVHPANAAPPDAVSFHVPVVSRRTGAVHGELRFGHHDGGAFTDRDERLVVGIAAQAAVAIDNALLLDAERSARAVAEEAQRRRERLATAIERLASSLDVDATARTLASLVVPEPCQWACVELDDDAGVPQRRASVGPVPDELHTADRSARYPLWSGEGRLGTLHVGTADGEPPLDDDALGLVGDIARRASLALENALLYTQQRTTALALQRALLPQDRPEVDGLDTAIRYLPAASADVGGDWYDLHLADATTLTVAVGDVQGKGVQAAAYMGQVRAAVRAYTLAGLGPAAVVQFLDRMWEQQAEVLTTCVYAQLNVPTGMTRVAVAGHLPPLIVTAAGDARYAEVRPGAPLGAGVGLYLESELTIGPGDGLVLFTDGLVEHRRRDLATGMAQLAEVVAAAASSGWTADDVADAALAGMVDDDHDDDIAIVVLRREPAARTP